jgi:DNA ligase-1
MMSVLFKPMLATDCDPNKIRFPILASAKLDGVRAIVRGGVVYSRSNKPIPNHYVQEVLGKYEHFDGELIVGEPTSKSAYRDTVSHVMAHDKRDFDLRFYVFDHVLNPTAPYLSRFAHILPSDMVFRHEQHHIACIQTLNDLEERMLEQGYEGLILRGTQSPYKYGRSTVNEGYLLKVKRFVDAEFEVIGFEERMHNGNEATISELGRTKRSSHQENLTGRGDLGAIIVRYGDTTFNVGTGFDDAERATVWANREAYLGRLASVRYFAVGMKDVPRHPSFKGWRDKIDT